MTAWNLQRFGDVHDVSRAADGGAEKVVLELGGAVEVDAGEFGRLDRLHLSAALDDGVLVEINDDVAEHARGLLIHIVRQAHVLHRRFGTAGRVVVQDVIPVRPEGLHVVADQLGQVLRYADRSR